MRKINILNILLILSNMFFVSMFICIQLNKIVTTSVFWFGLSLSILTLFILLNEWSKLGLDVDRHKSNIIKRGFDDSTTLTSLFYILVIVVIVFYELFILGITGNKYVLTGIFAITIIFELLILLSIYVAKRDTTKLLNKQNMINK